MKTILLSCLFGIISISRAEPVVKCPSIGFMSIEDSVSDTTFYKCINGLSIKSQCATGLIFNNLYGECVSPMAHQLEVYAETNPCLSNSASTVSMHPIPGVCNRYIRCIGQTPSEVSCPPSLYFNPTYGGCDKVGDPNCVSVQPPPVQPPPNPPPPSVPPSDIAPEGTCYRDTNFEVLASLSSCNSFTICACGVGHIQTCANNLIFDVRTRTCNSREIGAVCLPEFRPVCPPGVVKEIAHPYDCRHNVLCVNGVPTVRPCPPGTEANQATGLCDFPHIAKCTARRQYFG